MTFASEHAILLGRNLVYEVSDLKTVIGIDVGGSTTKIVGFHTEGQRKTLIPPLFVRATDPLTSVYGAFGKFTDENNLALSDISEIHMTGAGASYLTKPIYGLPCVPVPEFRSIGLGGLYLSGLSSAIVVSMGTGTALVYAEKGKEPLYLGGTGVGGGTIVGLSKKLVGIESIDHLSQIASEGDLKNIDLFVGDIMQKGNHTSLSANLTASNFGKLSDMASPADLSLGILNMVYETIGMLSIFAARQYGLSDIVLIGNLATLPFAKPKFKELSDMFGVRFLQPENAQFGTVIGAALCEK